MTWRIRQKAMALPVAIGLALTTGCETLAPDPCPSSLTSSYIANGLRDLLAQALERVLGQLGRTDGYYADRDVRVPLPESLDRARGLLQALGSGPVLSDLELRLNRAAEVTAPRARTAFEGAISRVQFQDPAAVFRGGERSASRYFRDQAAAPLAAELRPLVERNLADMGAFQAVDDLTTRHVGVTLPRQFQGEMVAHVLEAALRGIFDYLGREEGVIRADPALRSQQLQCLFKRLV